MSGKQGKNTIEPTSINFSGIVRGVIYSLEEFKRITGLGETAMRTARQNGLTMRYSGKRGFVSGDDFLEYHAKLPTREPAKT